MTEIVLSSVKDLVERHHLVTKVYLDNLMLGEFGLDADLVFCNKYLFGFGSKGAFGILLLQLIRFQHFKTILPSHLISAGFESKPLNKSTEF
jgi:hypothetical protein